MKGLIRFTLSQAVFFNIFFVILVVVGIYTLFVVPVERYPAVNMGKARIQAFYPGASPEDVEALVTSEIEKALEDLDHLDYIRSTSNRQRAYTMVKFEDDSDYDAIYDDMRLRVLSVMGELPAGVDPPQFAQLNSDLLYPVISVNLSGARSNRTLTLIAEEMKSSLRQIPGVREIELKGEHRREYHVTLDPDKMVRLGITFDEVARAMKDANISVPAGDMDTPEGEYVLLIDEQYRSREQVARTIVRLDGDGSFVRIADVMNSAGIAYRDPSVISSVNGKDCVTLNVLKNPTGNALDMVAAVERIIKDNKPGLDREGVVAVLTQDSTVKIKDALSTLGWNLLLGIVLVCGLIWYFMGFRNAGLTTVGIPFAFLMTMIFLYMSGNSLNEITLFSFILISGIVVDDAIVVIENIYRHLQYGKSISEAVIDGTAEVFLPVVSATLTTVAAFLPMLIMTGSIGEFFAQIPTAVSFALIASLLECLFILPIHYKDFGPQPDPSEAQENHEEKEIGSVKLLRGPVDRLMRLGLRFRFTSMLLLMVAFGITLTITMISISGRASIIRVKFFPDDFASYYVDVEAPKGTSIEKMNEFLKAISTQLVAEGPGQTRAVQAYAGYVLTEDFEVTLNSNVGHLLVTLPSKSDTHFADYPTNDQMAHLDDVRHRIAHFSKQGFHISVRPQKDGPPTGKDINVRAVGSNQASVLLLADKMKRFLAEDPRLSQELVNLADSRGQSNRVFRFSVRHDRAAELSVTPARVTRLTAGALNGRYVGEFRDGDEQIDLKLKIAGLESPEAALAIPLLEHPSGPVRLGDLNRTQIDEEEGFLSRFQGERSVNISANLRAGSSLSSVVVVSMAQDFYQTVRNECPGAGLNFVGEFEDTRRSFSSLFRAFLIALLLIYVILATQFQSYLQPLIVLSAILYAFIGVTTGLLVTRGLLTINNMIAMVGVVGVVVNDSLVLIEFINKLYRAGVPRREAIVRGMHIRLRPILLTTLTTALAFLPMALGIPTYSIVWGSMASTFVTGLCTATFLTLFLVPVQWDLITELKEKWSIGKGARIRDLSPKDP